MNAVFEHEVAKVLIRFYKVIKHLQILQVSPLVVIKDVEVVLTRVQLHVLALVHQILFLICNGLISLLELLFLLLQTSNLFVDLLLHHSI